MRYSERVSQGIKLDSTASVLETFQIESCVRGHHIYNGEELTCSSEIENTKDPFAVAVKRRTNLESARDYIKIASRAGKDH